MLRSWTLLCVILAATVVAQAASSGTGDRPANNVSPLMLHLVDENGAAVPAADAFAFPRTPKGWRTPAAKWVRSNASGRITFQVDDLSSAALGEKPEGE